MTQVQLARSFRLLFYFALFAAFSLTLITTTPAHAASFTINTTLDAPDSNPGDGLCRSTIGNRCSLRAAIQEANALSGTDTINVPAGTFLLTRSGFDDTAVNGDLDINSTLIINGASQSATIIDGNDLDRVFHITGNFKVAMKNLTI
ncbi:MAG: CSLREA domain-containing protein, partial [Chloroflexi bacterium]|nr:CSLREA domain-containing protein [Chloroflexota bacterium]